YFNQEISLQFIDCAHQQIARILDSTVPESSMHARLYWLPLPNKLEYQKGAVCSLKSQLLMSYGQLKVNICWTAKSGKIYGIEDTDIDCGDIVFTVEGLDAEKIKHAIKPVWSLFTFPEDTILTFREQNKLSLSTTFIRCADNQLSKEFEARTGIKINQHIGLLSISTSLFYYEKGEVSKIAIVLYVNHNWNETSIQWTSKSGRIYDTADEDIPCDDIVFSFDESFDALLYHKQMYPKVELPFKLKNLPFEVKIERLNIDCVITMTLKDGYADQAEEVAQKIDKYIDDFNTKAEKKGEDCVHNWLTTAQNNTLVCEMDSGFVGPEILKALFKLFAKMDLFSKVVVE
ncbi:MAG: hypothetical protein ACTHLE_05315, partial [Agriterribacter sp.]